MAMGTMADVAWRGDRCMDQQVAKRRTVNVCSSSYSLTAVSGCVRVDELFLVSSVGQCQTVAAALHDGGDDVAWGVAAG